MVWLRNLLKVFYECPAERQNSKKRAGEAKQQFVIINVGDRQAIDIANQHNLVGADIILPRNPYNLIAAYFVGVGDLDDPLTRERHDMKL